VRRIDNIFIGTKTMSLLWFLLLGHHSRLTLLINVVGAPPYEYSAASTRNLRW